MQADTAFSFYLLATYSTIFPANNGETIGFYAVHDLDPASFGMYHLSEKWIQVWKLGFRILELANVPS